MHQSYAYTGKGKTIHSCGQSELYKNNLNDKSIKVPGGLQRIQTNDGYAISINVKNGLPYVQIRPYTDEEWDTLPHLILTSDVDWDPMVLEHTLDDDDEWFDAVSDLQTDPTTNLFDEFGNYRKCTVVVEENDTFFDTTTAVANKVTPEMPNIDFITDDCILHRNIGLYEAHSREVKTKEPTYGALHTFFGWLPIDINKRTFAATTQYARIPMRTTLKKHYKSPFPAMNVHRRDEPVATDTVYSLLTLVQPVPNSLWAPRPSSLPMYTE
jgi:hypothetical protein